MPGSFRTRRSGDPSTEPDSKGPLRPPGFRGARTRQTESEKSRRSGRRQRADAVAAAFLGLLLVALCRLRVGSAEVDLDMRRVLVVGERLPVGPHPPGHHHT